MNKQVNNRDVVFTLTAVVLAATTLFCMSGCRKSGQRPVSVVGSTSIQPFAELLEEEFARIHPEMKVEVQGGGSTAGLQAVSEGIARIGMCSRKLSDEEARKFTPIVIARDGLALIVHPKNPVANLSKDQIRSLFSGRIKEWKEVGGGQGPVRLIMREEGSGTREAFMKLIMGKEKVSRKSLVQESNGAVKELVKNDPCAVGYISLGLIHGEVKGLSVDGVAPTHENVMSGKYSLVRPFLFVVKGTPDAESQQFIDEVLSDAGQKILEREGLVRAK